MAARFTQVTNCEFLGNNGSYALDAAGSTVFLFNSVFSGNRNGGFSNAWGSGALVLNCTFANNHATNSAAALSNGGAARLENSVFWNNSTDCCVGAGIGIDPEAAVEVNYSVLQNWTHLLGGVGNVDLDPLFVDADGPDNILGTEDDNLRLSAFSPLINLGDPDPAAWPFLDGDGQARIIYDRIDMGAYEYGIGDIDFNHCISMHLWCSLKGCKTLAVGSAQRRPRTTRPTFLRP